jgi:hypothetical protein
VNRACLIGLVGCRPRPVGPDGELGLLVLTQRDPQGERVDRHRVILGAGQAQDVGDFTPGATVYVEGHLARHGPHARVSVIAERAWAITTAPPPPQETPPRGTHASPREHRREGHARRVAIGTAGERLVWVRPTTVRPGPTPVRTSVPYPALRHGPPSAR